MQIKMQIHGTAILFFKYTVERSLYTSSSSGPCSKNDYILQRRQRAYGPEGVTLPALVGASHMKQYNYLESANLCQVLQISAAILFCLCSRLTEEFTSGGMDFST